MAVSGFDVGLRGAAAALEVRRVRAEDRPAIETLLKAQPNFTAEEVATALEVIDEALAGDPDYTIFVVEDPESNGVAGYVCHGPTPLTIGTFDLYWIAVDPRAQKRGYGRVLLAAAEDDVKQRGGRLLLIETSSQESYDATIRFYKRAGYRLEARIADFYKPGDDKLVFAKNVGA